MVIFVLSYPIDHKNDRRSFLKKKGKGRNDMKKLAEFITKHKNIIILLAVILLIPSGIGYVSTRVNYDILSYLPDSLETVKGQDVMVD